MTMFRPIHVAIRLAVAMFLLALGLRTWLVMGLIEPVTIAGSSMVPTLRGPYVVATCPECKTTIEVGAEFAASAAEVACSHCGLPRVTLDALTVEQADRLWIDRTLFSRREPRRWEVVVLRQPDDGRQLCVKRVVGLPGETIRLSSGDVRVNGQIAVKPFEQQCALRQLVHRCDTDQQRWHAEVASAWNWSNDRWQHAISDNDQLSWLRYIHVDGLHPGEQPITDDVPFNAGVSRRLNPVPDFMLNAEIQAVGKGSFALAIQDGSHRLQLKIHPSSGTLTLTENGIQQESKDLSANTINRLGRQPIPLALSNFDRQLLLVFDGKIELRHQLHQQAPPTGTARPIAIAAQGLEISLRGLALYRDVYYSPTRLSTWGTESQASIQLGPDQYFLLGDNAPISVDSRFWGPVSGRILLGAPLGVR